MGLNSLDEEDAAMAMTMTMTTSLMISVTISSSNIALFMLATFLLFSSAHCFSNKYQPPDTFRGLVVAEKTRLGSTPPSCHNKCNQCQPCMAVQVPTLPSHRVVKPRSSAGDKRPVDYFDSSPGNRYSNYKPLGWKCRCGGHFYNP